MKCPVCNVDLVMSERSGVEIDYCPQCRGVWLDRGELDKIVERSGASASPATSVPREESRPQYSDDRRSSSENSDYPKKKKKESFLGDLFDF
jgi:Zn-finger nucleic acid-binding protein